jgi:hypothetical protein
VAGGEGVIGIGRAVTFVERSRDDPDIARFVLRAGGHSFGNTCLALEQGPEDGQGAPGKFDRGA